MERDQVQSNSEGAEAKFEEIYGTGSSTGVVTRK